jgi:hypothetical protein
MVDAELKKIVHRATLGDEEAFGRIYDAFADTIYKFIKLKINDSVQAEDILQDVFLKAWQGIPKLNLTSNIHAEFGSLTTLTTSPERNKRKSGIDFRLTLREQNGTNNSCALLPLSLRASSFQKIPSETCGTTTTMGLVSCMPTVVRFV